MSLREAQKSWTNFVSKVQSENPGMSFKDAMKEARRRRLQGEEMTRSGESAAAAIIPQNEDNIFGIMSLKSKRVLPKGSGVYTNLLGIHEKSPKELANQAEQQALLAEEQAAKLQAITNRAAIAAAEFHNGKERQIKEAQQRIRNTPRNTRGGLLQPSEHNKLEHWKSGMYRTWSENRRPKNYMNAYAASQKAHKSAKTMRNRATAARRTANQNKNFLVFPTRVEELADLFNSPASGAAAGAGGGAAAGAGGSAEAEGGRRRKRKTRKGKKRSYRKRTSR